MTNGSTTLGNRQVNLCYDYDIRTKPDRSRPQRQGAWTCYSLAAKRQSAPIGLRSHLVLRDSLPFDRSALSRASQKLPTVYIGGGRAHGVDTRPLPALAPHRWAANDFAAFARLETHGSGHESRSQLGLPHARGAFLPVQATVRAGCNTSPGSAARSALAAFKKTPWAGTNVWSSGTDVPHAPPMAYKAKSREPNRRTQYTARARGVTGEYDGNLSADCAN